MMERHGEGHGTRLYSVWSSMKRRCYGRNHHAFSRYGGKGITVCGEWVNSFITFREWALSNGYDETLSLDRYPDKNGGYTPENCRWANLSQQGRNKNNNKLLTAFNETKCEADWLEDGRCCVKLTTLRYRLKTGWRPETALTTPARPRKQTGLDSSSWSEN